MSTYQISRTFRSLVAVISRPGLGSRIASGAFWSMISAGLAQGSGMLATMACARLLGSVEYGKLGIVISTANLFATFAGLGLGVTAAKHVAEYHRTDPHRAGRIIGVSTMTALTFGILVAVALSLSASWLCRVSLHSPELAGNVRLGSVVMLFYAINGAQTGVLSGLEAFKSLATGNLLKAAVTLPIILVGAISGGRTGVIVAYGVCGLLTCLIYSAVIKKQCKRHNIVITYHLRRRELELVLRFSIPVVVAGLSFTPAVWWTNALLIRRSGYGQSGIFNAVLQWQMVILFFANAAANLGLPILSSVLPEKNIKTYKRVLYINFLLTTLLALFVAVPVAMAAPLVMKLYGPGFKGGSAALVLIAASAVLSAMNVSVGHAIWSLNATVAGMVLSFMRGALLAVAAYFLVSRGATGMALSYVVMGTVQTAVCAVYIQWLLRRTSVHWEGAMGSQRLVLLQRA